MNSYSWVSYETSRWDCEIRSLDINLTSRPKYRDLTRSLHTYYLRELPPQNFGVVSFWDVARTASAEFWVGFFLRFGGTTIPSQNYGLDSFWNVAETASTEFWSGFFLRRGGNCLHRILEWILFEIRQDYLHKIFGDSIDWHNRPDMTQCKELTLRLIDLRTAVRIFDQITILQRLFSSQLSFST